jgi:hypothetical protein
VSDNTWHATFVHPQHPWRDFEHTFEGDREIPPASIRRPALLAGMPAVDVYLLSDSEPWPASSVFTYTAVDVYLLSDSEPWPASSVFTYTESLLGDLADHRPPDYCIDMPPSEGTPSPS